MRKSVYLLLLASVLSFASCDKNDKNDKNQYEGTVHSVALSQQNIELFAGKRSGDITVTVNGEGSFNQTVKITSEDANIAYTSFTEVDNGQTFKVYGKTIGQTKINVTSIQDETKAASINVSVIEKQEVVVSEIQSVSLDRETKLFKLSDEPLDVLVTVNGLGEFDNRVNVSISGEACVSVDKTSLASGEKFRVSPIAVSENEEPTVITVSSIQDPDKIATLSVKVNPDAIPPVPQVEQVQLDPISRTLTVGEVLTVSSLVKGGDAVWTTSNNEGNYIEIVNDSTSNLGAQIRALAVTLENEPAKLVATVGEASAECAITVVEPPKEFHTYYVSNNSYLNYDEVYFYTWNENDESNAVWPGVKLENPIKNTGGEDCYPFEVDVLKFHNFKFNNGKVDTPEFKETVEGAYAQFGNNDNVWFNEEGIHYAIMQKDEPTIRLHEKVVSILNGTSETFTFDCYKGDASYEFLEGSEFIEDVALTNGTITLKGAAVGEAKIRIYIEGTEAEDILTVKVLDSSNYKHLYFTNNFDWPDVYFYAWGQNGNNAEWPGEQLSEIGLNSFGQHVFDFYLNTVKWTGFVISSTNGQQSSDVQVTDERLNSFDNIYLETTQDELGHYNVGFANFEPASTDPSVKFKQNEVTLYEGHNKVIDVVTLNGSGVTYDITSGSDYVEIVNSNDSSIELAWEAAGSATIRASLSGSSDELVVTCASEPLPETIKTIYFTNNKGWEHVYLYAWGDNGDNGAWPGVELTHSQENNFSEMVFDFEIDSEIYHSFIINNSGYQTRDISLSEEGFATNNNIYLDGDDNPYDIGFANFEPALPPVPTVSFAKDEVTLYSNKDEVVAVNAENGSGVVYEVTSGNTFVEITAQSDTSITLHYLAEGEAVITATLADSSDTLAVSCVASEAPKTIKNLYFSNNYGWDQVYLYAWTDEGPTNASWPGVELTHYQLNSLNEKVFDFEIDSAVYEKFIMNNGMGAQTRNIALSEEGFATNNNIYIVGDNSPYDIGFANFEPALPPEPVVSVSFAVDAITVHEGSDEVVNVSAENGSGVVYEIISGDGFVEITAQSDTSITLHYLAEGNAVIKATLGDATDTLAVTCAAASVEMVTVRFSNGIGASNIVAKVYNSASDPTPDFNTGLINATSSYVNEAGQTVYAFNVDKASNDRIVFIDANDHTNRTAAADLTSATNSSAWWPGEKADGVYPLNSWTYEEARYIYLNAGIWDADGAVMFIYYWDDVNGVSGTGLKMDCIDIENHIYRASVPVSANQIIFVRMQNGTESFDWDKKWNQTGDLSFYDASKNQYNITDWNDGDNSHWSHFGE